MNNLTPVPRTPSNALISPVLQDVSTDEQLLGEWLKDLFNAGMGISQNTLSQYSLEGRRLLWFANAVERRFQAWDKPTANAYLTFRASPPEHAIGDSRTKNSGAWRPFRKPPSAASVKQSAIIARSFFNWLVDQQAIRVNPLPRPPRSRENRGPGTQQRYLNITQLKAVFDAIAARPAEMFWDRLKQDRDRMVIALAFQTGLRASEMAELRWSDFQRRDGKHGPYWVIVVRHAKSGDNQVVPCDAAMEEISAFRRTIGLGPEPKANDTIAVIPCIAGGKRKRVKPHGSLDLQLLLQRGVTTRHGIYAIVKDAFKQAADLLRDLGDELSADGLEHASTHWLRHSAATHLLRSGKSVTNVQRVLRHQDINTTRRYTHEEMDDLAHDVSDGLMLDNILRK